jgi:hypothetical protein
MALLLGACDPHRLDLFLRDRLPEEARRDVEAHLLSCAPCRDRLDDLAGGARAWAEVRLYLGDQDDAAECSTAAADAEQGDVALNCLTPSDNPQALGRLGPYEILEILGRGGWGVVLKAFDPALNRPVAIKVLAARYAASGAARKRFAREAQAAAAVSHDHVVPVHAVDAAATPPYLVMAFIPGQSLQQRLDRSGPLAVKEILRIGMQTAAGLAAAHAQGLVHRDIKPANIMLENGIERVKITDFGLARAVDDASLTLGGAVAGTPAYMAPEQALGQSIDQRADLFSLGSTLYAMCTGRAPFRGECGLAVLRQVSDVEPASIRTINPDVPPWLEGIVRKLHAKEPERRFQSATEVAELLARCLAHVQQPERQRLPGLATELGRQVAGPAGRRRWPGLAGLAAAVVGGGVLLLLPGPEPNPRHTEARPAARAGPDETSAVQPAVEAFDLEPALDAMRRRTDELQDSLERGVEPGPDPVADQLDGVRRRLEALAKEIQRHE